MFGFASFAALRACVSRDWTPVIGDPEVTGWLTVLAYLLCMVLAVLVLARRPPQAARGLWLLIAQPEFDLRYEHHGVHFWLVLAAAIVATTVAVPPPIRAIISSASSRSTGCPRR